LDAASRTTEDERRCGMKETFEHAYERVCDFIVGFTDFALSLCKCILVVLVYATIPLWIIPYGIYKKMKGGE
jgi:hypothetical protein